MVLPNDRCFLYQLNTDARLVLLEQIVQFMVYSFLNLFNTDVCFNLMDMVSLAMDLPKDMYFLYLLNTEVRLVLLELVF